MAIKPEMSDPYPLDEEFKTDFLSTDTDPGDQTLEEIKSQVELAITELEEVTRRLSLVTERAPQLRSEAAGTFTETVTLFTRFTEWSEPIMAYHYELKEERQKQKEEDKASKRLGRSYG